MCVRDHFSSLMAPHGITCQWSFFPWLFRKKSTDFFLVWIHIDGRFRPIFGWNQRSMRYRPYFQVCESLSTVYITIFSSRWILIDSRYRPYSQVGKSWSTVDIDHDRSTSRLKSNRPIDDTCGILLFQAKIQIPTVSIWRQIFESWSRYSTRVHLVSDTNR